MEFFSTRVTDNRPKAGKRAALTPSEQAYEREWFQSKPITTSDEIKTKFGGRVPLRYGMDADGVFRRRRPEAGNPLRDWAAYYCPSVWESDANGIYERRDPQPSDPHTSTVAFYNLNGSNQLYNMGVRIVWDEQALAPVRIGDERTSIHYCVRCLEPANVLCESCRAAVHVEIQKREAVLARIAMEKKLLKEKREAQTQAWARKKADEGKSVAEAPLPPIATTVSDDEINDALSKLGRR